jgi:MoaA/NifB/PqqE/SkfB family radical SAM enzyme
MRFPTYISLTITNRCNLHCQMCGQWSKEGYLHNKKIKQKQEMGLKEWKKIIDELKAHNVKSLLLRGGEPFLFKEIIELLEYINSKGIFISMDTNGTMLREFAQDIVRIGNIHLTISIDGPEKIHDRVRGRQGCFNKIIAGVMLLHELEEESRQEISKSINFTISPYSLNGLGAMPEVARSIGIKTICIVPYYYVPEGIGRKYEQELKDNLDSPAFSWIGFHHEDSGIDFADFKREYGKYLAELKEVKNFPFMDFSLADYQLWFKDPCLPVGKIDCTNIEKLIDVQPDGRVNFCVDFPDYSFGNVKENTIAELWSNKKAERFREYRRKKPLAVCYRCGAKYMSLLNC